MTTFALRIDHRAWLDKPEVATAIGLSLDHPAFRELRRVSYYKGARYTRHQPRAAAAVEEILLSKDCDAAEVDSGRAGKETAFGMIYTGRHILHWDADKRVIDSHVVVPYDAANPRCDRRGSSPVSPSRMRRAIGGGLRMAPGIIHVHVKASRCNIGRHLDAD